MVAVVYKIVRDDDGTYAVTRDGTRIESGLTREAAERALEAAAGSAHRASRDS